MANEGEVLPNHPVHAADDVQAQQHNLLDAARALMLLGAAVAAAAVSTACNCDPDADAAAAQVFIAFIGFVTWLLGVFLLSLVPVAARFPQADRLAGAAIANAGAAIANAGAVIRRFFIPWN